MELGVVDCENLGGLIDQNAKSGTENDGGRRGLPEASAKGLRGTLKRGHRTPGCVLEDPNVSCGLEETLLALLIACVQPDDNRFPWGGDPWTVPEDDTSVDSSSDDTGAPLEGSPVITEILAGWCDIPQYGDVIVVYVSFVDAEEDVEGGRVLVEIEGNSLMGSDQKEGLPIDSGGDVQDARILDSGDHAGDLYFAVDPPEKAQYELEIRLRDEDNNESAVSTVTAGEDLPAELCTGNTG